MVDFRPAPGEDEASWTTFLTDLWSRGVRAATTKWDEGPALLTTDGDGVLEAARLLVYDGMPHQRCVFHRLQNLADHVEDRVHMKALRRKTAAICTGLALPRRSRDGGRGRSGGGPPSPGR